MLDIKVASSDVFRRNDAKYNNRKVQKNAVRSATRQKNEKIFIGIDGEGVTREDGKHEYVLLSVGDKSYHENDNPLTTEGIFQFLWDCFLDEPDAVYAGFYLSYDFTMWLKDLPEDRARMLFSKKGIAQRQRKKGKNLRPFPVYWNEWQFDLLGMKRFRLRKGTEGPWMYINDAGSFFQTSFLQAIDPSKWQTPICTPEEYEIVREGKTRRATARFDPEMMRYNVLENELLSRLLSTLNDGFVKMNVRLDRTRWFGPGQVAQSWLNNIKAPDRDVAKYDVPGPVQDAAVASYYGGWFEIFAHGHIPGPSYEYDINSAYPHAIASLPCLEHGVWTHNPDEPNEYTLCYVTVHGSNNKLGTMPCRSSTGTICRPLHVRGWYWYSELEAARKAGAIDHIEFHEAWRYDQSCNHAPLSSIADLYLERLASGKDTPYGKSLKLNYNSAYGKFAQSVGEPRYANPIYASLITSRCRTQVWNAISSHPHGVESLTMVATDAVFFREPHPYLSISDKLGDWGEAKLSNLLQYMPGLYWDDKARSGAGKPKSRGINASDLSSAIERADDRWHRFRRRIEWCRDEPWDREMYILQKETDKVIPGYVVMTEGWPFLSIPLRFNLISAPLALNRNRWDTAGTVVPDSSRMLSGRPGDKRAVGPYIHDDIVWTCPRLFGRDGIETTPYDKTFGLSLVERRMDAGLTERGTFDEEIYEQLRIMGDSHE